MNIFLRGFYFMFISAFTLFCGCNDRVASSEIAALQLMKDLTLDLYLNGELNIRYINLLKGEVECLEFYATPPFEEQVMKINSGEVMAVAKFNFFKSRTKWAAVSFMDSVEVEFVNEAPRNERMKALYLRSRK